jgi:hypothetical protein
MTNCWALRNDITEATKKLILRDMATILKNGPLVNKKLAEFSEKSDGSGRPHILYSKYGPHP